MRYYHLLNYIKKILVIHFIIQSSPLSVLIVIVLFYFTNLIIYIYRYLPLAYVNRFGMMCQIVLLLALWRLQDAEIKLHTVTQETEYVFGQENTENISYYDNIALYALYVYNGIYLFALYFRLNILYFKKEID